jgi:hypothetical protein
MSVSNGQKANATNFNNAFLSRTTNSDTTGVVGLNNTSDPNSGDQVVNTQRAINETFDAVGMTGEGDGNRNNYASNNFVVDGDSRKVAIERLDTQLATTNTTASDALTEANDLRTLSGTSAPEVDLGTFTGTTIPDASTVKSALQSLETAVEARIPATEKGAANGVATLDAGSKIPSSQIPASFVSLQGNWNASTNTPTLADGVGDVGDIYRVSVAGTQDLGSGSITYSVGDWVYYRTDLVWDKTDNVDAVTSVNGASGIVVLDTDDISEGSTNLYFTNARADARADVRIAAASVDDLADVDTTTTTPLSGDALVWDGVNWVPDQVGGAVDSVNGQTGVVVLDTDDVNEGAGNLYFTTERAQDAAGAMATNSSKVSLTYDDGANTLTPDIVAGSLVNADINASAAINRSKLASGTADHVVINDNSGVMSSEAQLAISRGGTGQATANAALNALLPSQASNANKFLRTDGTNTSWQTVTASGSVPTIQRFTSGSGTYTTPVGCIAIRVKMVGGGGGGTGATGNGGNGSATTFGTSLLTANGGSSSNGSGQIGGAGGGVTVNSPAVTVFAFEGPGGHPGQNTPSTGGGNGASSFLGGGGRGGANAGTQAGQNAIANTGSGGGGLGSTGGGSGGGGGAGGYIEALISSPSASYSYTVGAGGAAGTGSPLGGLGADGIIVVEEYY